MVNAMNKVLKDCILDITMPFLDDIPIKGCSGEEKDKAKDEDIAMLRWIAYVKLLNSEIRHVAGKHNVFADMLSRARCDREEDPRSDEEEVSLDFFTSSYARVLTTFVEEDYEGEFVEIGKYLSTLQRDESWSTEDFHRIQKKAYKYFLKDGALWRHAKKKNGTPIQVIYKPTDQQKLSCEFHDSAWAGHRGIWVTFAKLKEKYWWLGIYKDVAAYVETCKECQMFSNVRHRDELHPTYLLAIHYKWMVDIVMMHMGRSHMKYLVLAREDITN
jgi:hypothetical protein